MGPPGSRVADDGEKSKTTLLGFVNTSCQVLVLCAILIHVPTIQGSLFTDAQDAADAQWEPLPRLSTAYFCRDYSDYRGQAIEDDGYFFCDGYVDYAAACNANDATSCNNAFAIEMFNNFQRSINVYSCSTYSQIWTCSNCSDAYKRWLCSQVYHKNYLPGTELTEEGFVGGGGVDGRSSFSVDCNRILTLDPDDFNDEGYIVRLCWGWSARSLAELVDASKEAQAEEAGASFASCGTTGTCNGNLPLDPATSSPIDGFYIGAKVEIIDGIAFGQWAEIEEYDGNNRIALFTEWKPPPASPNSDIKYPTATDRYRIYLAPPAQLRDGEDEAAMKVREEEVRMRQIGKCRDSRDQRQRQGSPCELDLFVDEEGQKLERLPSKWMGGSRCMDEDQCIPINKTQTARIDANGMPVQPDTGYLCCPKDKRVLTSTKKQNYYRYTLYTNETDGTNTCMEQFANEEEWLDTTAASVFGPATAAEPAITISGCRYNFTVSSDTAQDFCVLKTCYPVCYDVIRRCPIHLDFNCPSLSDSREYDHSACNIMLAHGCSVLLKEDTQCTDLNIFGYGPAYSQGQGLFGLPPGADCRIPPNVGLVRMEPPQAPPAVGEKANRNHYWHENTNGERIFDPQGDKVSVVCQKKDSTP